MSTLGPWEHLGIGSFAGVVECCVMQPTVAIKNAMQEGRPVPWAKPIQLYRGLLVNAGSFAPITGIQFGANRVIETALNTAGYEATGLSRVAVATGAGATSALVACPAELIMIQQQRAGTSLSHEAKAIVARYGTQKLFRGLSMQATRDGLYTAGYLGVCPALQEQLAQTSTFKDAPGGVTFVVAGIISRLSAATVTHPADTIKTRMQAFLDTKAKPEYATWVSTCRHLVKHHGVGILFSGLAPRAVRISGATIILQTVRSTLVDYIEASRLQEVPNA